MDERSADLNDTRLYIDRELSLLDFFGRVLEEAQDSGGVDPRGTAGERPPPVPGADA